MSEFEPVYIETKKNGGLKEKINVARSRLRSCDICPRECRVDRIMDEKGLCRVGESAKIASFGPHFGEEPPLVGMMGSGTIFFSGCNLMCAFCQNYDISCLDSGEEASYGQIAGTMLSLQNAGCHNINLVTPTHVVPQILAALDMAIDGGLRIPLVYNSSGYDSVSTLKLLDGIFDIYMPDFKFWQSAVAEFACQAPDYPEVARLALLEMWRQVGDLELDEHGIAKRGILVRHLVLPEDMAGTRDIMTFIATNVSRNSYVNVMNQYRPCGEVIGHEKWGRLITSNEFRKAINLTKAVGINRIAGE